MTTERRSRTTISGIPVTIVRKDIKNLHLAVYPPEGRVRVAAPRSMTMAAVRLAVIYRLTWVKKQRLNFQKQERLPRPEYVTGESHYLHGRRYRLRVTSTRGKPEVFVRKNYIELRTPRASRTTREAILHRFYKEELKKISAPLIEKWTLKTKAKVPRWGVKAMKTKWGSYSRKTRQVWLNVELAKKPVRCVEYIVLHEIIHSVVPNHGEKFQGLMKRYLPNWEAVRRELNKGPIAAGN